MNPPTLPQNKLWHDLLWTPLKDEKSRISIIFVSLLVLAVSQSLFLLLVGPFLKALFSLGTMETIAFKEIAPAKFTEMFPQLAALSFERDLLTTWVPGLMIIAALFKSLATYFFQFNQQAISLALAKNYRERLFCSILKQKYLDISKFSPGFWMSKIMNDVVFLQNRFADFSSTIIKDSILILACLIAIAFIHLPTAVILAVFAPFLALYLGKLGKKIAVHAENWQRQLSYITACVLDLRDRFMFIRSQKGEKIEKDRFKTINHQYYDSVKKSILLRSAFAPGLEFFGFVVFAFFLLLLGKGTWSEFDGADIIQFFAALGLLLRPLKNLGEQLSRFQETRGSLNESLALFQKTGTSFDFDVEDNLLKEEKNAELQSFTISSVAISYGEKKGFSGRDLHLSPGKSIAIVGPSGSGKSSLLKCLSGLMEPSSWEGNISWQDFVASSALVGQTPFLFNESVRANLEYGQNKTLDENNIWTSLDTVNLRQEVESMPSGLEEQIQTINSNVSGGQLQRLVIARALLRGKKVLLLDEATSAIDAKSEKDITERLLKSNKAEGNILIAVTHRVEWLSLFDEVWYIENGELCFKGAHEDLIRDHSIYSSYVSI